MFESKGRTCTLALPGCTGYADQVHHVRGKAHGDDLRWLEPACGWCNRRTGDPAAADRADPAPRPLTRW